MKYASGHRGLSNKITNSGIYPIETVSLLKSLCGPQGTKSFLNHCKLYFKVSDEREGTLLEHFLVENNLNNYFGIFNIQDKYAESTNLYNLKGVGCKDDHLIILEDRNALNH
jgi:hypothetical protein